MSDRDPEILTAAPQATILERIRETGEWDAWVEECLERSETMVDESEDDDLDEDEEGFWR